jgi:hypothetical protein
MIWIRIKIVQLYHISEEKSDISNCPTSIIMRGAVARNTGETRQDHDMSLVQYVATERHHEEIFTFAREGDRPRTRHSLLVRTVEK